MTLYTIPQCPEMLFHTIKKELRKARYHILEQIIELINSDELHITLPEGFSARQIIEITEEDLMADGEDKVTQAVKILSKLADSKRKIQILHDEAMKIRNLINLLFDSQKISDEQYQNLDKGFKILREYAHAHLRYKEALIEAEEARVILDETLAIIK